MMSELLNRDREEAEFCYSHLVDKPQMNTHKHECNRNNLFVFIRVYSWQINNCAA
jgi:hypothetical protein